MSNPEVPIVKLPEDPEQRAWLYRPSSIRKLWIGLYVLLGLTVVAQFGVHVHDHFGVDGWFAFSAAYGFLSCVSMVLFAKGLGYLIKRPDDYYEPKDESESGEGAADV
ncbi:MAG: hypothetical protein KDI71_06950 [Xanthomonadales bacterium]|nr:hypothetical protein [Xanthomonadales bacterium]